MKISNLNPKLEIRKSPIQGKGIFANDFIKKGEIVIPRFENDDKSKIMTDEEFEAYKKTVDSWDSIALGNGTHKVGIGSREDDESNYGNHSCEPNTLTSVNGTIANRDIKPGEEITIDYSQFSELGWEMDCNCKSKNCTGKVKGKVK